VFLIKISLLLLNNGMSDNEYIIFAPKYDNPFISDIFISAIFSVLFIFLGSPVKIPLTSV